MKSAVLLLMMTLVICMPSCSKKTNMKIGAVSARDSVDTETKDPKTISMAFVGDLMLGTVFPENAPAITEDHGKSLFKECKQYLKGADVAIGNLEGVCFDGNDGTIVKDLKKSTTYIFKMPADHAPVFSEAGIDILNMANNHSIDFGPEGRVQTIKTIRGCGIEVTGIRELCEGTVIERKGVKIGYVCFAGTCKNCLDINNYNEVKRVIKEWRPRCDILAVGFHGGAEGASASHVTRQKETYVGEQRGNVYEFAHLCIDLGADIVVGHGPHVPRAMELYKDHLIAYSLGNFCTPFKISIAGISGYAPLLETTINVKNGTFAGGRIVSFRQSHGVGPYLDKENNAARQISTLTKQDFPDTSLLIKEDGTIMSKD